MAIDFYELGRQTGAKTLKGRQSGLQSLVGSIDKTISGMLKTSQAKTTALTAAMPQGIPIDKVPEELRTKATEFLTKNKTAYTDATKVIASGINAQSQRYKDAVETINRVNTRFENLSTSLEAVALKRKASLDDPMGYSPGTNPEDRLTWSNLGNGDLYAGMTFNEDGTVSYTDSKGVSKPFADFNVSPQSFEGQNTFLALNDKYTGAKYSGKTKNWSLHSGEAELRINQLFQKLKPAGQKDMMMADVLYLEKLTGFEAGTDEYEAEYNKLLENPADAIAGYKSHILETLENNYNDQSGPIVPGGEKTNIGFVEARKDITIYGGNQYWDYDQAKLAYDALVKANNGEAASFKFKDKEMYNYDPATGKWSVDDGVETTTYQGNLDLVQGLGIGNPDFLKLGMGSTIETDVKPVVRTIKNTSLMTDGSKYNGGVISNDLTGTDDLVSSNLNDRLLNNNKNYRFVPWVKAGYTVEDQPFDNSVMLVDGNGHAVMEDGTTTGEVQSKLERGDSRAFKFNTSGNSWDRSTLNVVDNSAKSINDILSKIGLTLEEGDGLYVEE